MHVITGFDGVREIAKWKGLSKTWKEFTKEGKGFPLNGKVFPLVDNLWIECG